MKIAVAGSGALGSGFGARLYQAEYDVTLIDSWEPQVHAVKKQGLNIVINGDNFNLDIPIYHSTEIPENAIYDMVFLFPKSMQLSSVMDYMAPHIDDNTIIVCTMNGLKHERVLHKYVKESQIVRGVTTWTAGIESPGHTHLLGSGPVEVGALVDEAKPQVEKVVTVLNNARLNGVVSQDLHQSIWKKICVNGTANALTAVLECNLATLNESDYAQTLIYKLTQEIVHVATVDDVHLNVDEVFEYLIDLNDKVGPHYPSMYQDLIVNNRKTEIDYINGAVAKLGKEHHIAAPVNQFITDLVHAKESQRGAQ
ncbi:2-dehydropantoate 2-reductase [Staphylococcus simiae]|uniref:2-dehydropantoate 2-reductase n=1 Tax=Staphylococcus simiae CCM 7213 = CCUG 51256 TaxID=911238 RepID=G5JKG9_9STAP|nr:2-dehydropantoate 2-reductase [Staphylococcus simiae]EHJ07316.1 2-dehydropantoate 2-reductase [Staphylococcus simiae CCM 7213 = CCUG 51256]PNZ14307.1 2-dehydropantoate 2-reductase [Staphylococcus simiae]SNV81383.1 2-dehydropantoate 2-reductase [Staphylococcus simiae]